MTARPGQGSGHGPDPHDDSREDRASHGRRHRNDDHGAYENVDRGEYENHDRGEHEGRDGREGYDGMDALMAAVLDVPLSGLSEEARADPAYLAAHRSATADVALLREQLGVLAEALTEAVPAEPVRERAVAPAAAPVRRPRPARRFRQPALRLAGAAAAGALVLGGGWMVVQVGQGVGDSAASKSADSAAGSDEKADASAGDGAGLLGDPGYLACARLVVEGDVTAVGPVAGATRERVTLHVTRAYRPAGAGPEVAFEMAADMDPLLRAGDHVLVALSKGSATPDVWAVGEADIAPEREAIARALPGTEGVTCE
ncbi:hypothetical protein [Streptomyces maremycinicus]|uniref:hypothetical protein n=1 Tax=Streptomyces maremycinicus TaxID=1679753 RepID=UPI0007875093|nr:hypothetical protein [Streptomyces sp. NBRC 110468]